VEPASEDGGDRGGTSDNSHGTYRRDPSHDTATDTGPTTSQLHRDTASNVPSCQPTDAPRSPRSQRDEEIRKRRGGNDGELGEDETRPRKRTKTSASCALDDTYHSIDTQPKITSFNNERASCMSDVARQLTAKIRDTSNDPDNDFPERDLSILLSIMLVDTFGETGLKNLGCLLQDHVQDRSHNVRAVACELAASQGPMVNTELASLYRDWALIVGIEDINRSRVGQLLLMKVKLNVVRRWDRFKSLSPQERECLSRFLDEEGFPKPDDPKAKCSLMSRLGAYMRQMLKLRDARSFTDRIYRWKPLAILVDTFGEGILPLITPKLEEKIRRLKSAGQMSKSVKFTAFIRQVSITLPGLTEACQFIDVNVTQPILNAKPFPFNTKTVRRILTGAKDVQNSDVNQESATVFELWKVMVAESVQEVADSEQEDAESGGDSAPQLQNKGQESSSTSLQQPLVIESRDD